MIRAYEQKIKDEEARKIQKIKAQHRISAIRKLRKVGYRSKANKKNKTLDKNGILLKAVQNGDAEQVSAMIKGGGDPEHEDSNGSPLLQIAVRNNDAATVNALIDWRASLNTKTRKDGNSAIILACYYADKNVMTALLKAGANPNIRDSRNGQTALLTCLTLQKIDLFDIVFDIGKGNPRLADNRGVTPLMVAARYGLIECIKKIVLYPKLFVDMKDKTNGLTALMWAARYGQYKAAELLLTHKAKKSRKDFTGQLAMTWAEMFGAHQSLVLLLHPKVPFVPPEEEDEDADLYSDDEGET